MLKTIPPPVLPSYPDAALFTHRIAKTLFFFIMPPASLLSVGFSLKNNAPETLVYTITINVIWRFMK
jgi:hypothetical protein